MRTPETPSPKNVSASDAASGATSGSATGTAPGATPGGAPGAAPSGADTGTPPDPAPASAAGGASGGAGGPPPSAAGAAAAGSPGGGSGASSDGAPGGTPGATPGGTPPTSFFGRYQSVAKDDFESLKKGLKVVGGAALATLSFGYGFARQIIVHPTRTAQDVKAEVAKLAAAISSGTKSAVQSAEEKLMFAEAKQLTAKINSLPGLTDDQKTKVVGALKRSVDGIISAQATSIQEGSLVSVPFKYGAHLWKMMAAVRSHERLVDVLGSASKFSDKYAKHYPDKCSGFFTKIVDDMSDGRMSPFEWFGRRVQLAAAGITNRVLLTVDPFRAHSGYTGAGAAA